MCQGFGIGGAAGVASVRRPQKLPPCQTEPVLASSRMNSPLARAEPINNIGSAYVLMYLRRGKNDFTIAPGESENTCKKILCRH